MNHTLSPGQPRDHLFDNIKALMLFLVPLGHTLDVFIADGNVEEILMKYIYLFHMPIFAFVTGYFTKNLDKARENAVKKCLIPYLVFQGLYILMAVAMLRLGLAQFNAGTFNASILLPSSAFYYLLAVFFWKLLGKSFFSFRHPLALSVALGLLISCTSYQDFHAGLGAVFSLLPFFVLGVLCTRETVERIRKIPKLVGVLILLAGSLPAVFLPYSIHSVRMTYGSVGFSNLEGIGYRVIFYVTAALFTAAFINLMPARKHWFSQIGTASILVYAGSTFLAPHAYILIARLLHIPSAPWINIPAMCIFCLSVVLLCSRPIFLKWYQAVMDGLNRLIFKPEKTN